MHFTQSSKDMLFPPTLKVNVNRASNVALQKNAPPMLNLIGCSQRVNPV